jgi:3,5-epimerase/4-reductase
MRQSIKTFLFLLVFIQLACFGEETSKKVFLVFGGKTGWIGQKIVGLLKDQGYVVYAAESRLENRCDLEKEIIRLNPDYIMNCAGVAGTPNVDWCESNQQQTIRTNIIGSLNLADVAYLHGIHLTNFGTGCIYEYDAGHLMDSGKGFKEEDPPNFEGSFYSKTKILLEKILNFYPNVLNLRLRMPISSDSHSKNFITKITKYQKVINIPNSMTILDDLLPVAIQMTERKLKGNYNFVNPGTISHNQILDLYREYIDPNFTYTNFTIEEQDKILKARRSNNELDASKLLKEFPEILPIQQSIIFVFKKMQKNE